MILDDTGDRMLESQKRTRSGGEHESYLPTGGVAAFPILDFRRIFDEVWWIKLVNILPGPISQTLSGWLEVDEYVSVVSSLQREWALNPNGDGSNAMFG